MPYEQNSCYQCAPTSHRHMEMHIFSSRAGQVTWQWVPLCIQMRFRLCLQTDNYDLKKEDLSHPLSSLKRNQDGRTQGGGSLPPLQVKAAPPPSHGSTPSCGLGWRRTCSRPRGSPFHTCCSHPVSSLSGQWINHAEVQTLVCEMLGMEHI